MNTFQSNFSENEDDPDVYESSGDEWELEEQKSKNKRRSSQRLSKKPKVTHVETSDSEEDDSEPSPKNGVNRKQKATATNANQTAPAVQASKPNATSGNMFMTGSFLILKKDAQSGDPLKHPCIWKIDGKALLQKYEPFEDEGKVKHRTTSIYTGWSALDKDLYAPINVSVLSHAGQKMIVELKWEQLKEINNESD